jgi:hypothetical protein
LVDELHAEGEKGPGMTEDEARRPLAVDRMTFDRLIRIADRLALQLRIPARCILGPN